MLVTVSSTLFFFFSAGLTFWFPDYSKNAVKFYEITHGETSGILTKENVPLVFGIIFITSAIIGVPSGVVIARKLSLKLTNIVDPLVSGLGVLLSVPVLLTAMLIFNSNILGSLICQFIRLALYDTVVAVMSDVLLYVLDPTRRSFGQGIFFMVQSLFGEAPSPYINGLLAQHMKPRILETHPQVQVLCIIFVMPLVDPSFHGRLVEVAIPSHVNI